jgi:hypothetical protein
MCLRAYLRCSGPCAAAAVKSNNQLWIMLDKLPVGCVCARICAAGAPCAAAAAKRHIN